uniref:Uncharacterized protein n=1 Tax=viral metagenome TaxID=1070528 RepID=A0A6M3X7G8_9ZZZZ
MVSKIVNDYLEKKGIELNEISTDELEELFVIIEQKAREDELEQCNCSRFGCALQDEILLGTFRTDEIFELKERIAELEGLLSRWKVSGETDDSTLEADTNKALKKKEEMK